MNVIQFKRDATFFVNWGMRLLHRFDHERALKCFHRAVELEPTNAEYMCHQASVLAEMGKYDESNHILHMVMEGIDSASTDVYFFLANNYANMEDFEMAEEMAQRYLQTGSNGMYAEEAEDLLQYIYYELDMPPRNYTGTSPDDVYGKHEQARRSLEEGRFLEAVECLRSILDTNPSFMPAWNNLALAYYYIGDFDQAVATIEQALTTEPGNLHAVCNLAVLMSYQSSVMELLPVIMRLKKVKPIHYEHTYKLATTMGVLGQHEEAYHLYKRIIRRFYHQDAPTYHYAATAAYLTDRFEQATRWWQRAKQLDPVSGVPDYYLTKVQDIQGGKPKDFIPYHYQHPQKEIKLENAHNVSRDDFKSDPMIRASLLWALQHGKEESKPMVIKTLALIADDEAETALRHFCKTATNPDLIKLALLALREIGAELPYEVGEHVSGMQQAKETDLVIRAINFHFDYSQTADLHRFATRVWKAYVTAQAGEQLPTRKLEAWVAALEYLYAKQTNRKTTQAALAKRYDISDSTIAKCIKVLLSIDLNQF